MSKALMVQGTTSDAGKSTLVTGLCRVLHRRGVRVAPFKPQNMALNSAVTVDGGEIGRAQAVQAQACGIEPHTDMNPVLLKPNTDIGAQVIIHGKPVADMDARRYHAYKPTAMAAVLESFGRLKNAFEAVVVEGAGSPAEINLRENDIANMGFAEAADVPVVLIADIDRGGVFAHIVGTLALLSPSEQRRVQGFVINRFRGDLALLRPGLEWLERETGKPVFGVLPFLQGMHLEAEDALPRTGSQKANARFKVAVPALPRISNHTDFDPLRLHPEVELQFVGPGDRITGADLIILPGSKSVRSDLQWLRKHDWEREIARHLRYGGKVIGLCGGFQMLGDSISDPYGIEGPAGAEPGLGYLRISTVIEKEKVLQRAQGRLAWTNASVTGYEIHMGVTTGTGLERPAVQLEGRIDGSISEDGALLGTYLHGFFDDAQACRALLAWAGMREAGAVDYAAAREAGIDAVADAVERHLAVDRLFSGLDMRLPA